MPVVALAPSFASQKRLRSQLERHRTVLAGSTFPKTNAGSSPVAGSKRASLQVPVLRIFPKMVIVGKAIVALLEAGKTSFGGGHRSVA